MAKRPASSRPTLSATTNAASWLLTSAVFLAPIATLTAASDSFRLPKLVVAGTLVSWAIALAVVDPLRRGGLTAVAAFVRARLGWLTIALVASLTLAVVTSSRLDLSVPALVRALPIVLVVPLVLALGHGDARLDRRLEHAILIAAGLDALAALAQAKGLWTPITFANPAVIETRAAVIGWVGNAGTLGIFLAVAFAIALRRGLTGGRAWLGFAGLLLLAIAASATLTAVAAAVLSAVILLAGRLQELAGSPARRRWVVSVLVVAVVAAALTPTVRLRVSEKLGALDSGSLDRLLTSRLAPWNAAFELFREDPLLGSGLATFPARYYELRLAAIAADPTVKERQLQRQTPGEAHNDPLQLLGEGGLLATLPILLVTAAVLIGAYRLHRDDDPLTLAVLAPALLGSFFQFPFQTIATAIPMLIFAGRALRSLVPPVSVERREGGRLGTVLAAIVAALALVSSLRYARDLSASMRVARAEAVASQASTLPGAGGAPLLRRALQDAERAVALDPTSVEALNAVAACRFLMRDLEGAKTGWERARALEPRVDIDFRLAGVAREMGHADEAATIYRRVLSFDHGWAARMDDALLVELGREDLVSWKERQKGQAP